MGTADNTSGSFRVNAGKTRSKSLHMTTLYHAQFGGTLPQSWPVPVAALPTGYAVATLGPGVALVKSILLGGALVAGGIGIPDIPRNVVVVVTHATSIVAMTAVITGVDINGTAQTENVTVPATGTTVTLTGKKIFKYISDVTFTSLVDASADTITIGTGNALPLDAKNSALTIISEQMDGVAAGVAGVLTIGGADPADLRGTYAPNAVPNAVHTYDVWYISDDPWNS